MTLGYRWRIVALLFAASTINYVDRSVLGVLAPTLQYKVFHWSNADFAAISVVFKAAYAIGLIGAGALIDRWGVRFGYFALIVLWSISSLMHALIRPSFGLVGFLVARFGLGLGEAGTFPASIKAVSTWFPAKERALAIGIFNSGSNMGAVLAPALTFLLVLPSGAGWQRVFCMTSILSSLWCIAWLRTYRDPEHHRRVTATELRWIQSDTLEGQPAPSSWTEIIRQPITWGVFILRLADAAWWFYLFWGGKFLFDRFGLDIRALAFPLITIYALADLGSIGGGWIGSQLIRLGWPPIRARKLTMLGCALLALPVASVPHLNVRWHWIAILLIGLAAAAHQAWAANMFSLIGDCIPREVVATVTGLSGMVGVLSGMAADVLVGKALTDSGVDGYSAAFLCFSTLYLLVLGLFHLLTPRLPTCVSQTG